MPGYGIHRQGTSNRYSLRYPLLTPLLKLMHFLNKSSLALRGLLGSKHYSYMSK
jgi:hypothetical protein